MKKEGIPVGVVWGLKDNNSWRDSNPLLYNAALQRKSAWYAVRPALRHRTLVDTPVSQIQEDQHGSETVEPAVQDDGVNQGDPDPDDVE